MGLRVIFVKSLGSLLIVVTFFSLRKAFWLEISFERLRSFFGFTAGKELSSYCKFASFSDL